MANVLIRKGNLDRYVQREDDVKIQGENGHL